MYARFIAQGKSEKEAEDLAYQVEQLVERYGISEEQAIARVLPAGTGARVNVPSETKALTWDELHKGACTTKENTSSFKTMK